MCLSLQCHLQSPLAVPYVTRAARCPALATQGQGSALWRSQGSSFLFCLSCLCLLGDCEADEKEGGVLGGLPLCPPHTFVVRKYAVFSLFDEVFGSFFIWGATTPHREDIAYGRVCVCVLMLFCL